MKLWGITLAMGLFFSVGAVATKLSSVLGALLCVIGGMLIAWAVEDGEGRR